MRVKIIDIHKEDGFNFIKNKLIGKLGSFDFENITEINYASGRFYFDEPMLHNHESRDDLFFFAVKVEVLDEAVQDTSSTANAEG